MYLLLMYLLLMYLPHISVKDTLLFSNEQPDLTLIGTNMYIDITYHNVYIHRTRHSGCVRLASLGLPRGAHSGEPPKRTITQRSRGDVIHLGPVSKWPTPQAGHPGMTSKLFKRTGSRPGSTQGS